jgi:hypothetical protein
MAGTTGADDEHEETKADTSPGRPWIRASGDPMKYPAKSSPIRILPFIWGRKTPHKVSAHDTASKRP